MTTHTQVNKLYSKLDNHQLAALAFDALVRGDADEFGLINGCVSKRPYLCPDDQYARRAIDCLTFGLFYGNVYWKERAYLYAAENKHNSEKTEQSEAMMYRFVDRVIAMDTALQDVCAKVGIDPMAVKKMAGCVDEYHPDRCTNSALVAKYVELFEGSYVGLS